MFRDESLKTSFLKTLSAIACLNCCSIFVCLWNRNNAGLFQIDANVLVILHSFWLRVDHLNRLGAGFFLIIVNILAIVLYFSWLIRLLTVNFNSIDCIRGRILAGFF